MVQQIFVTTMFHPKTSIQKQIIIKIMIWEAIHKPIPIILLNGLPSRRRWPRSSAFDQLQSHCWCVSVFTMQPMLSTDSMNKISECEVLLAWPGTLTRWPTYTMECQCGSTFCSSSFCYRPSGFILQEVYVMQPQEITYCQVFFWRRQTLDPCIEEHRWWLRTLWRWRMWLRSHQILVLHHCVQAPNKCMQHRIVLMVTM